MLRTEQTVRKLEQLGQVTVMEVLLECPTRDK